MTGVAAGIVLLLGLGVPLMAATGSPPNEPGPLTQVQPDQKSSTFRIMAMGSSSTQGVGATSPVASYPQQLEHLFNDPTRNHLEVSVANRGVGGEDITDMLRRLPNELATNKPDLVIFQVGSNDPLRGVPLDRFKAELRRGIAEIRASGAEVMLMEPQWSPRLEAADSANHFIDAVREIGDEEHVEVVRRFEMMRHWIKDGLVTQANLVGPDGLHMTDIGYALLAQAVHAQIEAKSTAFRGRQDLASAAKHP